MSGRGQCRACGNEDRVRGAQRLCASCTLAGIYFCRLCDAQTGLLVGPRRECPEGHRGHGDLCPACTTGWGMVCPDADEARLVQEVMA